MLIGQSQGQIEALFIISRIPKSGYITFSFWSISGLIPHGDNFETKRKRVNLILADLCSENDYAFIKHINIDVSKHLYQSLIHLNRTGAKLLESNLIHALHY